MAENLQCESIGSPNTSESNDADFSMNADLMVHEIDDERTIEEEEMLESGEEFSNEVNNLQKEGDMPIEDLLALYGYDGDAEHTEVPLEEIRPEPLNPFSPQTEATVTDKKDTTISREDDNASVSSGGSISRASFGQSANSREENGYDPFQNQRITRGIASLHAHYFENDDTSDDEYQPMAEEWKKEVSLGPDYQANVPEYLSAYKDNKKAYENEDKLLWRPDVADDKQLKRYLSDILGSPEGGNSFRDDEQALYLLMQCGSVEDALKKKDDQSKLPSDATPWSGEECRNFELGLRIYGKDFRQIQRNKIPHRTVGDIVQLYYIWKKTERYDAFCSQTRFGKKKYVTPGIADYMDRFMDEAESLVSSRSASPHPQKMVGNLSPAEVSTDQQAEQPISAPQVQQPLHVQHTTLSGKPRQQSYNPTGSLGNHHSSIGSHHSSIGSHHSSAGSNHSSVGSHPSSVGIHHSSAGSHPSSVSSNHSSAGSHHSSHRQGIPMYTNSAPSHQFGSYVPSTSTHIKPTPSNAASTAVTIKDSTLFPSTTNAYHTTLYDAGHGFNSYSSSIPPTEALVVRGLDTWAHDSKLPIIEPMIFGASNQGAYKIGQNNANQRSVSFCGGGFNTSTISQSVE